jgi:hypothetical protein
MATKGHEPLYDEGLEIVCSVTLQEAIEAVARLVPRESAPTGHPDPEETHERLPKRTSSARTARPAA